MSFTSCDSENTTGSLAENEPPDSEICLGMFGRQEGSEGVVCKSDVQTDWGVLVKREETVEKPDLPQTELTVDALVFFLGVKRVTLAARGRGTQGGSAPEI